MSELPRMRKGRRYRFVDGSGRWVVGALVARQRAKGEVNLIFQEDGLDPVTYGLAGISLVQPDEEARP